MNDEKKLNGEMGLDDDALDAVIGGTGTSPAAPVPTGSVNYTCKCGYTFNADTRAMTVTCPKCRCAYQVKKGNLVPV